MVSFPLASCTAARDIKILKKLEDAEVTEKESATFMCEVSHNEVDCQWFKNDTKIKAGDNIKLRQEGEPVGALQQV